MSYNFARSFHFLEGRNTFFPYFASFASCEVKDGKVVKLEVLKGDEWIDWTKYLDGNGNLKMEEIENE